MAERRPIVLVNGELQELPSGDTLPSVGGGSSASFIGAKLVPTTDLNIPATTNTNVTFASTVFDTSAFWNVSQPTRMTIPADVSYVEIVAYFIARFAQSSTTDFIIRLKKNGTSFQVIIIENQFWGPPLISSGVLPVVAGDYFEVELWCTEQWEIDATRSFATIKSALGAQGIQGIQGVAGSTMVQSEIVSTTHTVSNTDLSGNVIRRMNNGSPTTITVAPDLTGTEPVTFIRTGSGTVTFAEGAGVTILSARGNLSIADQYGSATLIPDSTTDNTYYLIGNLTT